MTAGSVRIIGSLNAQLLKDCIDAVVRRHESLRTRIILTEGVFNQSIDGSSGSHIEITDLSDVAAGNMEREAKNHAVEFLERKIDVSVGPLFEALLIKLSHREHVLILALDHLVSDGVSNLILNREVWALYDHAIQGIPFVLPKLSVQFADYAVWQERTYEAWRQNHEGYWRQRLASTPCLQLPFDTEFGDPRQPKTVVLQLPFERSVNRELWDVARQERTLPSIVVLTTYVATLSNFFKQRDLVLKFISHGRHEHPELANMIGFVANTLYLRIEIEKDDTFRELLTKIKHELHAAYSHRDFDRVPDLIPGCETELSFNWIATDSTHQSHQSENTDNRVRIEPFSLESLQQIVTNPMDTLPKISSHVPTAFLTLPLCQSDSRLRGAAERFACDFKLIFAKLTRNPLTLVV